MKTCNKTLDALLKNVGRVEGVKGVNFNAKDGAIFRDSYIHQLKTPLFSKYIFPESKEEEINVVLEETILNSVSACKEVESKNIEVSAYYGSKGILFDLKDEGPGFNYKSTLARRSAMKLPQREKILARNLKNGGHGLYALMSFADKFRYSDKGNRLYFVFNLQKLKNKKD